ncbi:MAG: insulinase family protein, partial [Candidatus Aureabacteria bacterium]|nr:insulinase family protein [Candidatus Auribacterota bacterium]
MRSAIALALVLILTRSAPAADNPLRLDVIEHRLPNGLTLLILEHRQAPIVACALVYRVGSVNEEIGATGITHLLEHMMFKGTESVGTRDFRREKPLLDTIQNLREQLASLEDRTPPDPAREKRLREEIEKAERDAGAFAVQNELWKLYTRHGATRLNAFTGRDRTVYVCSLPANRLELWMQLESDRMQHAVFREFYRERDVVLEERRLSVEDSPEGAFDEALQATAFIAHPYRWPVIGWKSDLEHLTPDVLAS